MGTCLAPGAGMRLLQRERRSIEAEARAFAGFMQPDAASVEIAFSKEE